MHEVAQSASGNGHVKHEDALANKRRQAEALVEEINERLARINGWGIELKGIDEGLVDFPSERDGRVVYLCWRLGEDAHRLVARDRGGVRRAPAALIGADALHNVVSTRATIPRLVPSDPWRACIVGNSCATRARHDRFWIVAIGSRGFALCAARIALGGCVA